jgi:hypothetical protein
MCVFDFMAQFKHLFGGQLVTGMPLTGVELILLMSGIGLTP